MLSPHVILRKFTLVKYLFELNACLVFKLS